MKKLILFLAAVLLTVGCTPSKQCVEKEIIAVDGVPAAVGPYSQAVKIGNMLYLSGQLGIDPATGQFPEGGFIEQARQSLENGKTIIEGAGFTLEDVVQCQVFVKDLEQYGSFNSLYTEYFKTDYPARAVLEVSRIPKDGLIEIMMVAVK